MQIFNTNAGMGSIQKQKNLQHKGICHFKMISLKMRKMIQILLQNTLHSLFP